jgi:hypothetical protein
MRPIVVVIAAALLVGIYSARADCIDFSRVAGWSYINSTTIMVYKQHYVQPEPYAVLKLAGCIVNKFSRIRFPTDMSCGYATIVVDGVRCSVVSIKRVDQVCPLAP